MPRRRNSKRGSGDRERASACECANFGAPEIHWPTVALRPSGLGRSFGTSHGKKPGSHGTLRAARSKHNRLLDKTSSVEQVAGHDGTPSWCVTSGRPLIADQGKDGAFQNPLRRLVRGMMRTHRLQGRDRNQRPKPPHPRCSWWVTGTLLAPPSTASNLLEKSVGMPTLQCGRPCRSHALKRRGSFRAGSRSG